MDVVAAIGLFPPEGLPEIAAMLDEFFAGTLGEGHSWIVDDDDGFLTGIAYFAPSA